MFLSYIEDTRKPEGRGSKVSTLGDRTWATAKVSKAVVYGLVLSYSRH